MTQRERDTSARAFITDRSMSESAEENKCDNRSRRALRVSYCTGQDGGQAQYRIICHGTL